MKVQSIVIGAASVLIIAGPACSKDAAGPTDAEIAHIAYTAGALDIEAGKHALAKAHSPAVRQFAETMVRDHQAVNDQALALVKKLGVTPQPNATSEGLAAKAQEQENRLKALTGAEFDRAYVLNEVTFHRNVNSALQSTLIPASDNAELKVLLKTGLALFQAHQVHAEQLASDTK
jgi:putative membrane protein